MYPQNQQQGNYPQDPVIKGKKVVKGFSKTDKASERITISFAPEEIANLQRALASITDAPRGLKFDIYITKRRSERGKEFLSPCFFVRKIAEPREDGFQQGGGQQNYQQQPAYQQPPAQQPNYQQAAPQQGQRSYHDLPPQMPPAAPTPQQEYAATVPPQHPLTGGSNVPSTQDKINELRNAR